MNKTIIIGDKSISKAQSELGNKSWPAFMQHDAIVEKYWPSLYTHFLDYQFASYTDKILAGVGNTIPLRWDDDFENLPDNGLDWAMEKAAKDFHNNLDPNLLVAVQILINPDVRSKGLSYEFIGLMKQIAQENGIKHIALPVRPTQKHMYPLVSMDEYMNWTNDKGEPFDAWLRVHKKAGGELISVCSRSMTILGNVNEWQEWTGLTFQSSGLYTVANALSPVSIDLEHDLGEYIEPNVWFIHTV